MADAGVGGVGGVGCRDFSYTRSREDFTESGCTYCTYSSLEMDRGSKTSQSPRPTAVGIAQTDLIPGTVGGSELDHLEAVASDCVYVGKNGRERANTGEHRQERPGADE